VRKQDSETNVRRFYFCCKRCGCGSNADGHPVSIALGVTHKLDIERMSALPGVKRTCPDVENGADDPKPTSSRTPLARVMFRSSGG
jgi:hypothetical protein